MLEVEAVAALTILILAFFVGFEVISKVPPLLHTPLMSGANAISGITLVGTLVTAGAQLTVFTTLLGFIAVTMAMLWKAKETVLNGVFSLEPPLEEGEGEIVIELDEPGTDDRSPEEKPKPMDPSLN